MILRFPSRQNESDTMQSSRFIIAMGVGALAVIGVIAGSTSVSGVVALAVALLVVLSMVLASMERQSTSAELIGARSKLADAETRIKEADAEIANLSNFDEVTGAYNERYFLDLLAQHRALAVRGTYFFALAVIEVDQYEQVVRANGLGRGN